MLDKRKNSTNRSSGLVTFLKGKMQFYVNSIGNCGYTTNLSISPKSTQISNITIRLLLLAFSTISHLQFIALQLTPVNNYTDVDYTSQSHTRRSPAQTRTRQTAVQSHTHNTLPLARSIDSHLLTLYLSNNVFIDLHLFQQFDHSSLRDVIISLLRRQVFYYMTFYLLYRALSSFNKSLTIIKKNCFF